MTVNRLSGELLKKRRTAVRLYFIFFCYLNSELCFSSPYGSHLETDIPRSRNCICPIFFVCSEHKWRRQRLSQ